MSIVINPFSYSTLPAYTRFLRNMADIFVRFAEPKVKDVTLTPMTKVVRKITFLGGCGCAGNNHAVSLCIKALIYHIAACSYNLKH